MLNYLTNWIQLATRLILICLLLFNSSCKKEYNCVCTNVLTNTQSVIESVKTTKLGSKGFKESCTKKETTNTNLKNCKVE